MVQSTDPKETQLKEAEVQRITISLPKELYSEVERIAEKDSRSMAFIIRKAVQAYVNEEQGLFAKK